VQQEGTALFNSMEQVFCMHVSVSLQEIISAFHENFHICCDKVVGEVQSEGNILEWFMLCRKSTITILNRTQCITITNRTQVCKSLLLANIIVIVNFIIIV